MKPSAFFRTLCVFMCSGLMSLGLCDLMMKHFISSSFSQSESVFFKPSAGRVSVLCLSFIDWSENLPAADFRCINRVYRVCLLSAAVSWNIDTYKTLFSIREASVNLLTGRVQLGNTYIYQTLSWCESICGAQTWFNAALQQDDVTFSPDCQRNCEISHNIDMEELAQKHWDVLSSSQSV